MLARFPRPVRWAGLLLGVLTVAALVVLVVHDRSSSAEAAAGPVTAPVPPAGRLYTQLGPPGWSQQAVWVLPVADGTVPATDPVTGVTAAITGQDRSTSGDRRAAGRAAGPVAVGAGTGRPHPLRRTAGRCPAVRPGDHPHRRDRGGADRHQQEHPVLAVDRRAGNRCRPAHRRQAHARRSGGSVLLTLPGDRVGYLHGGAVHTVQLLPRTTPGIAIDGAVLVVQPDTGAWWTLTGDTAPASITPAAPPGAGPVDRVLAVTGSRVLISWAPAAPDPKTPTVIVAGYDRDTGELIATTTTPAGAVARPAAVVGNDPAGLTATGPVILTDPPVGRPRVVRGRRGSPPPRPPTTSTAPSPTAGRPWSGPTASRSPLPDGTLIPTGTGGAFLPVLSQGRLYALTPEDGP